MTARLRVLTTREEIRPERLPGSTVVVIDVFLATTTLLTILENGARRVLPVASLAEAETLLRSLDPATRRSGGEQGALPVPGFDFGPFPDEFTPERVAGNDVVFLSTNGTVAISAAAGAERVLLANLRNASATARYLEEAAPDSLHIVCAGSLGRPSLEDLAGAAAILSEMRLDRWALNDGAWIARELARTHRGRWADLVREGRAGRWFARNGREDIFRFVVEFGASDLVAEVRGGELVRLGGLPRSRGWG